MSRIEQAYWNKRCLIEDIKARRWECFCFHIHGLYRAVGLEH